MIFMTDRKSLVFRFDDVEVREREFTLIKAGEVLSVEPKVFRLLLFLLHNPHRLTTKEELLNAVWGDAAVTESSLTRTIALLRRLLGDDIREPRYIATVPTVGYRLVCRVDVSEEELRDLNPPVDIDHLNQVGFNKAAENGTVSGAVEQPSRIVGEVRREAIPPTKSESRTQILRRRWRSAALVLALLIIGLVWYLRRPSPHLRVSEFTQLTHDGRHMVPLGTDGVRLFLNVYPHQNPPAQVAVSGGEIVRIPMALPEPWIADVSPDGANLLVLSSYEGLGRGIWSVQSAGSSIRHLIDGEVRSAAWSPDSKFVVFSTVNGDVNIVRSDGSGAQKLANLPYRVDNFYFERLAWSPDGKTIRFDRNDRIYEIKPDGSGLHQFLPQWRSPLAMCCGQWTADGRVFLFLSFDPSVSTDAILQPKSQLWALFEHPGPLRRDNKPIQLTSGPTRWGRPIPAKDGKRIFAMGATLNGELVRADSESHQLQSYLGGRSAEPVSFSMDGQYIAYVTFPEGILWRANRDGTNPAQLTDPPMYPIFPRWSPDGAQILFASMNANGDLKSYLISAHGGTPHPLLSEDNGEQGNPDWSPDGHKIVFDSEEAAGETAKHVIRILDLASHQITKLPGDYRSPRWSPGGQFIAGLSGSTNNLCLFDLKKQQWRTLQEESIVDLAWSRDGQSLYFLRESSEPGVYRIPSQGGQSKRIIDLKGFHFTSMIGDSMGLDPEDMPILLRDEGGVNIYALRLEQK
jgi:Tol biopolymer transport system component/DNA-binding winged helix-turn-helix (wHTH) protein